MSLPGAHASCVLNAERSNRLVVNSTSFRCERFYAAKRDVARRMRALPAKTIFIYFRIYFSKNISSMPPSFAGGNKLKFVLHFYES